MAAVSQTRPSPRTWVANAGFAFRTERGKRALSLTVMQSGTRWMAFAIESSITRDIDVVLDEHAHKLIGRYKTPLKALRAAEKWADAWEASNAPIAETCACEELPDPT